MLAVNLHFQLVIFRFTIKIILSHNYEFCIASVCEALQQGQGKLEWSNVIMIN